MEEIAAEWFAWRSKIGEELWKENLSYLCSVAEPSRRFFLPLHRAQQQLLRDASGKDAIFSFPCLYFVFAV